MPHIVLEYSDNLPAAPDFGALFADIHAALHRLGGIKLENCKSRARAAQHCHVGDGDPGNGFIHLEVEFLAGREADARQAIGRECLELIRRHYGELLTDAAQITVRVADIAPEFYFKHPAGSLVYR